jgi:hypothetical protein
MSQNILQSGTQNAVKMPALYRHFDRHGALLYVGISARVVRRPNRRFERAPWFGRVHRVEIEHFATRKEANDAKLIAIVNERPIYDLQGNEGIHGRKKGVSWAIYQPDTGRADGWYRNYEDILEMFEFYESELPGAELRIVNWDDALRELCRSAILGNRRIYDLTPCALNARKNACKKPSAWN